LQPGGRRPDARAPLAASLASTRQLASDAIQATIDHSYELGDQISQHITALDEHAAARAATAPTPNRRRRFWQS